MWDHANGVHETCPTCRFDSSAYTNDDVSGSLRNVGRMTRWAFRGVDAELLNRRPEPTAWSALEYVRHMKGVVRAMRFLVGTALDASGTELDGSPPPDATANDEVPTLDPDRELARLDEEAAALRESWRTLDATGRTAHVLLNGERADVGGIVRHCVHELLHHLSDIGRTVAALSPPAMSGTVASVHAGRGVPKPSVTSAAVDYRGIPSDVQRVRRHHGRVWQAMCLFSAERIEALMAEGHPIFPGSCGENLVLAGVDWSALRAGMRLRFESGLELELTDTTTPCSTIADSFLERDFRRIDDGRYPGWSRVYARTVTDGLVTAGDHFTID